MSSKPQRDALTAAYSALTASSGLQHLDISNNFLPSGVWQHILPAGRQLPELRALNLASVWQTFAGSDAEYYDSVLHLQGTRLVSSCPGLQCLNLTRCACSAQLLAPLQGLSDLRTLLINCEDPTGVVLEEVRRMTGLGQLEFTRLETSVPGMMQLSQLKQLTSLRYEDDDDYIIATLVGVWAWLSVRSPALAACATALPLSCSTVVTNIMFCDTHMQTPGQEPIWRQVVQRHLDNVISNEVTQQHLAALVGSDSDSDSEPE